MLNWGQKRATPVIGQTPAGKGPEEQWNRTGKDIGGSPVPIRTVTRWQRPKGAKQDVPIATEPEGSNKLTHRPMT